MTSFLRQGLQIYPTRRMEVTNAEAISKTVLNPLPFTDIIIAHKSKSISRECSANTTIEQLKTSLEMETNILPENQKLLWKGIFAFPS